ncbi:MAG: S8 family serine peptidase [Deltaproteobacteria bacterium]|nr:S8 family serine peptidase [Deltaproteobacteria bacterium]
MRSWLGVSAALSLFVPWSAGAAKIKIPAQIREAGYAPLPAKSHQEVLIPGEDFKFDTSFGPFAAPALVGTLDCLPYNDLPPDDHPALAWRMATGVPHAKSGWNYHVIATAGVIAKGSRFVKLLSLECPPALDAPDSNGRRRIRTFINNWGFEVPRRDLFSFGLFESIEHAAKHGALDINMSDIKFARGCTPKRYSALAREADAVLAHRGKPSWDEALRAFNAKIKRAGCVLFWLGKALEKHPEILLFVSSGNAGFDNDKTGPVYPSHFPLSNVVVVAAAEDPVGRGRPRGGTVATCTTERGAVRWRIAIWPTKRRSAWGRRSVTLATNATDIMTTIERYTWWDGRDKLRPSPWFKIGNGTSLASPEAANVAAKIRLIAPRLSAAERKSLLIQTSDICPKSLLAVRSGGVVNPARAFVVAKRLRDDPKLSVDRAVKAEIGDAHHKRLAPFFSRMDISHGVR